MPSYTLVQVAFLAQSYDFLPWPPYLLKNQAGKGENLVIENIEAQALYIIHYTLYII